MAVSADLYRTFLGVGLYLSFSRAAKELGVPNPPSVKVLNN